MEDYTDQIELRLFDGFRQEDRIFSKYGEMLEKDAFVIVKGTIVADATADKVTPEKIYRNVKINIKHIELVEDKSDELLKKLTIYTQLEAIDQNLVEELTQLIVDNAGNTDFLLQVSDKSENSSVMLRSKHRVKVNTPFLSALEQMAKDKRLGFAINSRRYEPPTADNEEDDSEDSASLVEEIASEA
jgi:DNA polymerase III, alpha subunit